MNVPKAQPRRKTSVFLDAKKGSTIYRNFATRHVLRTKTQLLHAYPLMAVALTTEQR